ncbi:MAG TPA: hypothetical protein VGH53_21540 [Streptosporangiaceae bacterium]|jgi:hypothetical protein
MAIARFLSFVLDCPDLGAWRPLHIYGPGTSEAFGRWSSIGGRWRRPAGTLSLRR